MEGRGHERSYGVYNPFHVLENIRSAEPHHLITIVFHKPVTISIMPGTISSTMHLPVDLNNKSEGTAIEVRYVRPDRMLTAKFGTHSLRSKLLPEQDFRQTHVPAQFSSQENLRTKHVTDAPSTTPLRGAVPLPVPGRTHSAHPLMRIHASQLPRARSRTRPI